MELPEPARYSLERSTEESTHTESMSLGRVEGCSETSLIGTLKSLRVGDIAELWKDPKSMSLRLKELSSKFPAEKDSRIYTPIHPLVTRLRARNINCPLCAYFCWDGSIQAHELEECTKEESGDARLWLDMLRQYEAESSKPNDKRGATCEYCHFPQKLCYRVFYTEKMDERYGNEFNAQTQQNVYYRQVKCEWVGVVQRCVAAAMVIGNSKESGVGEIGARILKEMGWTERESLEEKDGLKGRMGRMKKWLEETDEIHGLRCPRLLLLFYLIAVFTYDENMWECMTASME